MWPFSLGFPTTESFVFGYLSKINEIALSVVSSPFKGMSALATVTILNLSLSNTLFFLKTVRSNPFGITSILFGSILRSSSISFFELREGVIIFLSLGATFLFILRNEYHLFLKNLCI